MNIKIAYAVLKQLQTSCPISPRGRLLLRVASRWLRASMAAEYDVFLRLQSLEGAAGIEIDTWWKKGRAALTTAATFFERDQVHPDWFTPGNTGMFDEVERIVRVEISRYKELSHRRVPVEALDVINNALMGLHLDPSLPSESKRRPAYVAGEIYSERIREGKDTPKTIGHGALGTYLKRKVSQEVKSMIREEGPLEETELEILPEGPPVEAGDFLIYLIFGNLTDPLGKRIRNFMRSTWRGQSGDPNKTHERAMDAWLNGVEKGKMLRREDIAEKVGITPQTFVQRHWYRAWERFFDALWRNHTLIRDLQLRFESEGVEWFQQKPASFGKMIDELKIRKERVKREISAIRRVADQFLSARSFSLTA